MIADGRIVAVGDGDGELFLESAPVAVIGLDADGVGALGFEVEDGVGLKLGTDDGE